MARHGLVVINRTIRATVNRAFIAIRVMKLKTCLQNGFISKKKSIFWILYVRIFYVRNFQRKLIHLYVDGYFD